MMKIEMVLRFVCFKHAILFIRSIKLYLCFQRIEKKCHQFNKSSICSRAFLQAAEHYFIFTVIWKISSFFIWATSDFLNKNCNILDDSWLSRCTGLDRVCANQNCSLLSCKPAHRYVWEIYLCRALRSRPFGIFSAASSYPHITPALWLWQLFQKVIFVIQKYCITAPLVLWAASVGWALVWFWLGFRFRVSPCWLS